MHTDGSCSSGFFISRPVIYWFFTRISSPDWHYTVLTRWIFFYGRRLLYMMLFFCFELYDVGMGKRSSVTCAQSDHYTFLFFWFHHFAKLVYTGNSKI